MFSNLLKLDVAPLLLRIGLGIVFVYHGASKIGGDGTNLGMAWHPDLPTIMQVLVAWGELLGGLALLAGFWTPLAALGIIAIMAGAIVTVTGAKGFDIRNNGFEYNLVLSLMSAAVILLGAGRFSLDHIMRRHKKLQTYPAR